MSLKVALLGTSGHTGLVLDGIPEIEDCEFVGVCPAEPGDDLSKITRHAAWTERSKVFEDPLVLLDEAKPDVVGVCMRLPKNAATTRLALERGISVVTEKPLATDLEDLRLLKATADHSTGRITAMFSFRFQPRFLAAQQAIAEGRIGAVCQAFGQKSYRWGKRAGWYRDRETYGGTIPWAGIHGIDYLRWCSGREFVSVQGLQANLVRKDYPGCEDCGGLLFETDLGGQAVLTFDYLRPAAAPTHGDDRLRLAGETGVIEVREADEFSQIVTDEKEPEALPPAETDRLFVDFVGELRGGPAHRISQEDAFRVTEIALLARQACDEKETVSLRPKSGK